MYVTRIDAEFEGDTWFPEINWEEWELIFFEQKKSKTGYMLTFSEYVRKNRNWKPELPEE
jgi:dihydrofolate reductase (trimethoprim resistance protein)